MNATEGAFSVTVDKERTSDGEYATRNSHHPLKQTKDSRKRKSFVFSFVENGRYILKASGNFLGGAHFEKMAHIHVKDGVVRLDLEV